MDGGGNSGHRHSVHSGGSGDGGYYDQFKNCRNGGDREESGQLIPSMTSLYHGEDGDAESGDQMSSVTHSGGRRYIHDSHGSGCDHAEVKRIHGYKDVPPEHITRHTQEARPYSKKRKVVQRRGS